MKSKFAFLIAITVLSLFALSLGVIPYAKRVGASALQQPQRTYTTSADFAEGILVGLEYTTVPNQLQLSREGGIPPYIWVPNQNEGSISKVDTRTGREAARYRTGGGTSANPSRTTVDLQGNCWVGNRNYASVVKVALAESDCVDRDGSGAIDTSRDSNGDGDITGAELLDWGKDECVLKEVVVAAGKEGTYTPGAFTNYSAYGDEGTRAMAIDANGNVWAGVYRDRKYFNISGADGAILRTIDVSSQSHNPYGAAIDRYGTLWSADVLTGFVLKINPMTGSLTKITLNHQAYGLGIDKLDHLFVSGWESSKLSRINVLTNQIDWTKDIEYRSRGVVVSDDNDVWVANSNSSRVIRWSNDGVPKTTISAGSGESSGVSIDQNGKIWVVNRNDSTIRRIDPATNTVDLPKTLNGTSGHYGYSDMTGKVARTVTTSTGTWTAVYDSGAANTPWGTISWNSLEPAGTSIRARVRSSANQTSWSTWEQAMKGVSLSATPANRYLQIEVTLQITTGGSSPILYDLTVASGSGGGTCAFAVSPTNQSFTSAGGTGSVNVTTGTGCNWTALSGYSWITINSGTSGAGSGTVNYIVAANTTASSRIGSMLIAGQFVVIAQSGAGGNCPITPLTIPQTVNGSLAAAGDCRSVIDSGAYGDLYSFTAQAGQRVAISLSSTQFDAFLTLIAPDGSIIAINDDSNSSVSTDSRIPPGSDYFVLPLGGTYIVETSSFNDDEVGGYTLSLTAPPGGQTCAYAVTPANQAFTAAGGNGTANVATSAGCGWTAGSNVSWITFGAGTSGTGSGTINYTVEANISLGYRVGRLLIAGQVLTVVQAGTGSNCPITPLVIPQTVNASWAVGDCTSGSGSLTDLYSFNGQAGQQVAISLTTTNTFTSIYLYLPNGQTIYAEGDGNLRIPSGGNFFVLPFTGTYIVEAGAAAAGNYILSLTVPSTQTCTYAITPTSQPFTATGGTGIVNVTAQSGCAWTATSNAAWITLTSGASGSGNGTVGFTVAINSDATRTGTITIAGQTFTVTQAGAGGALTLVDHLTTAGPISTTGCSLPPPKANFASTEARVYEWFYVLNPQVGDLIRWEFVQPNGTIYNSVERTNNFTGETCAWAWIDIAGQAAAALPGAWQVRVYWNGALLATDSFSILAVNNCPTVSGISPISGAVGSTVTISGANFTGVSAVKFSNNVSAQFTVNSNTQITATVPSGAVTGPVTLVKAGCTDVQTDSFTVTGASNCVQPPAGLLGWWPGDGNANDIQGANHGTLRNGATASAAGKVGQTFSFDGVDDHITLNSTGIVKGQTAVTCDAWVRPRGPHSNGYGYGGTVIHESVTGSGSNSRFGVFVFNDGRVNVFGRVNDGGSTQVTTTATLPLNQWSHIAGTWSATDGIRIYINGQQAASLPGPLGPFANGNSAFIAIGTDDPFAAGDEFNGDIDEVAIFNRALSASEIQTIFAADSAGKCKTTPTNCPVVSGITPSNGTVGSAVTLAGTNFTGVNAVQFASNVTAAFTVVNDTTITATVPNGAVSGPITISKTGCSDTSSETFTVTGGTTGCSTPSFAAAVNYPTGNLPVGVIAKDFNGDGRLDMATSNYTSSNVAIFLANNSGGFNSATYINAGSGPTAIASADFNGDSKFDLAVVNYDSNNVSILLGNGSGGFAAPANYAVGTTPRNLALADFNGDGKLDIAVANRASNNVSVLLGNGSGGFSAISPLSAGTETLGVAAGDFNGDGKQDIAASNGTSNNVSIFLGNGNGTFGAAVNYPTGSFPFAVTAADLDGDGKLDLATANFNSNNVSVLIGNGVGGFAAPVNYSVGSQAIHVAVNDFNLDGKSDLAVAVYGGGSVAILLGDGSGNFGTPTNLTVGNNPNYVAPVDLNGDGKVDLAVTNYQSASVSVLLNNCTTTTTCPIIANLSPTGGAIGATVTITGSNFTGLTAVRFANNVSAQFTVNSPTQITATVPSGAVTGPITISKTGCSDVQTATFTVTVPPACPTVSGINPTSGVTGSTVTITGANFTGVTAVKFASNLSAAFTVNSDTQITAAVPSGAVSGVITISKTGCNDVQTATFTVTVPPACPTVSGINPTSGAIGSTVTITGAYFTGVTSVKFAGNVTASFTVNSDTQITATVPSGAVSGPITISKTGCNDVQTSSFAVSTAPCITVAIATNLTGLSGGSLTVPIIASDTTGKGAISYDLTLNYDPTVLRLQATPFDRTGTLSAAMTVTTNTSVSGQLRLSAFGTNPLAGAGTLLNLKFDVIGAVSACSNLTWASFRFNEGTPCATTTNGRACAVGGSISGAVNYCITPKPVPGVTVSAAGTPSAQSMTNSAGAYQLTGLGGGPYTVTPAKTGDANGISSFDAAQIAQHVVGIITLNSCQQTAGDSSGDGGLSSFDAALIAQYVVGIPNPSSQVGTWKFVPPSRSYTTLSGDQSNQNFDAVLVGDVSGNWVAGAALAAMESPQNEGLAQQAIQVSLPELVAGAGTSLILPVTVGDLTGRGVLSYDFDLVYDANLLQAQTQPVDATDTLSGNFTVTPNATPGRLRVSGFGAMPLTGSGVLLKLRFNVVGSVGNNTTLNWQMFQFNEGNPATTAVPGRVTIINIYTLSLTPMSQTIALGGSASLTLVSSVAQPIAVTYPLLSSDPAIASVPASVTIPANATMATFAVTANAVGGPVTIRAGFAPLPGAPIATATLTVIRPVTCVSAASFLGQTLASEAIIAAFGTSLATRTEIATTVPLPTQLAGTTVSVRDSVGIVRMAPLFFVSEGQINYLIPASTAAGTATMTVTSGNGAVSTGTMMITSVAPGLFAANSNGLGVAAAVALRVKADGSQIYEPISQWDAAQQQFISVPIDLGPESEQVYLILYGTGIRFVSSLSAMSVTVGGSAVPVLYVGPQGDFVGLDQINLGPVPRSLAGRGEVDVVLMVDGKTANTVKVNVR
ncbi:MAG: VCBS repeat-containing protein [Acidobacteria bacterium]|nr:VCBS repeat-containing protein [Acidobacteriota bacterium]